MFFVCSVGFYACLSTERKGKMLCPTPSRRRIVRSDEITERL
jgi:hypothetical protein